MVYFVLWFNFWLQFCAFYNLDLCILNWVLGVLYSTFGCNLDSDSVLGCKWNAFWIGFGIEMDLELKWILIQLQVASFILLEVVFWSYAQKKKASDALWKTTKKVGAFAPTFYNKHKIVQTNPTKKWVINNFQSNFSSCFIVKPPLIFFHNVKHRLI